MKFSIVCPVYNNESLVSECIESVLRQTFANWELILMDDGSTDKSLSVCKKYEKTDLRIKVFSQSNSGPSRARVHAISKACGDYVCFIDSDDLMESNMLQTLSDYITKYENPDCILFKTYRFTDTEDRIDLHPDRNNMIELITGKEEIANKCFFETIYRGLQQDCYKRSIVAGVECPLEFEKNRFSEDTLYTFLYLKRCESVLKVPDFLYGYRINPAGTTFHINENDLIGNWNIMSHIYNDLLFNNSYSKVNSKLFVDWLYDDLFEYVWILSGNKNNYPILEKLRNERLTIFILNNRKPLKKHAKIQMFMYFFVHKQYNLLFFAKKIRKKSN